jgi:ankyrin repeat protein
MTNSTLLRGFSRRLNANLNNQSLANKARYKQMKALVEARLKNILYLNLLKCFSEQETVGKIPAKESEAIKKLKQHALDDCMKRYQATFKRCRYIEVDKVYVFSNKNNWEKACASHKKEAEAIIQNTVRLTFLPPSLRETRIEKIQRRLTESQNKEKSIQKQLRLRFHPDEEQSVDEFHAKTQTEFNLLMNLFSDHHKLPVDISSQLNRSYARVVPLSFALEKGQVDIAEKMVKAGANPWLVDASNKHAYDYAFQNMVDIDLNEHLKKYFLAVFQGGFNQVQYQLALRVASTKRLGKVLPQTEIVHYFKELTDMRQSLRVRIAEYLDQAGVLYDHAYYYRNDHLAREMRRKIENMLEHQFREAKKLDLDFEYAEQKVKDLEASHYELFNNKSTYFKLLEKDEDKLATCLVAKRKLPDKTILKQMRDNAFKLDIQVASHEGDIISLEKLLKSKKNIKKWVDIDECLLSAAQGGHANVVEFLIQNDANPYKANYAGQTSIDYFADRLFNIENNEILKEEIACRMKGVFLSAVFEEFGEEKVLTNQGRLNIIDRLALYSERVKENERKMLDDSLTYEQENIIINEPLKSNLLQAMEEMIDQLRETYLLELDLEYRDYSKDDFQARRQETFRELLTYKEQRLEAEYPIYRALEPRQYKRACELCEVVEARDLKAVKRKLLKWTKAERFHVLNRCYGLYSLHTACQEGETEIAAYLCKQGANLSRKDAVTSKSAESHAKKSKILDVLLERSEKYNQSFKNPISFFKSWVRSKRALKKVPDIVGK